MADGILIFHYQKIIIIRIDVFVVNILRVYFFSDDAAIKENMAYRKSIIFFCSQ